MGVKLKICGMKVPDNILQVADLQPDYMGFIFYKASKRYVDFLDAEFVKTLPLAIKKTGVFVDEDVDVLLKLVATYGLDAVQLHGTESAQYCAKLKQKLPAAVQLIKAFGVDDRFDFGQLQAFMRYADYFLFDTRTPGHGGSGKTFDWNLLSRYTLDKPYFLSGGIGLESAGALKKIKDHRLYAIDVNSRFELEPGLKNIDKLNDFKNKLS